MTLFFFIFVTALFSALIMVPFLRRWAVDSGVLDVPDDRKIHTASVPRLGGIAIFIAALFSLLLYIEFSQPIRGIVAGSVIVFFTGMIDDLYGLSPKKKFIGQIFACLITIITGELYISNLGDLGFGEIVLSPWLAVPFTVFAVVGVINAVNLMDGLDGLAGGISVISFGAFFILALQDGNIPCLALCAAFLGSVLGFLKYNSYPAIIFMGDTGSLTLGFFLGFIAISLTQSPQATVSPMMPLIILGLPIIDTLWVMARRVFYGSSPFAPDRTHVHHKFLDLGFHHRFTVVIIYGISLFVSVFALIFHGIPDYLLFFIYILLFILFYLSLKWLVYNKDKVAFFKKDTSQSLRSSSFFKRLVDICQLSVWLLFIVVLAYLVVVGFFCSSNKELIAYASIWTLIGGVFLLALTKNSANHFFMLILFIALFLLSFQVELSQTVPIFSDLTVGALTFWLTISGTVLLVLKIVFKKEQEVFLTTPLDFLILSLSVSFALVTPEMNLYIGFSSALLKAIIFFLAVKVISSLGQPTTRILAISINMVLVVNIIKYYF